MINNNNDDIVKVRVVHTDMLDSKWQLQLTNFNIITLWLMLNVSFIRKTNKRNKFKQHK